MISEAKRLKAELFDSGEQLDRVTAERDSLRAQNEKLRKALNELVWINEQHNRAIAQITGTPMGWKDTYLDAARAALSKEC